MSEVSLTWVGRTANTKTGDIPTAYVGTTLVEARKTCTGCPLLEKTCYAWAGFTALSMGRIEDRRAAKPETYSLAHALAKALPSAKAARIGALGDPSLADRAELMGAVQELRGRRLAVISYTHFWRDPHAAGLEGVCMASCEDVSEAAEARTKGWTPALLLPWDHVYEVGNTFRLPDGSKGLVCPAQTKAKVTCNDCRMCSLEHPVWKAKKITAIGFLDHSPAARWARRRWKGGRQGSLLGRAVRDVRPLPRAVPKLV